jgi:hypothetical protein
MKQVFQFIILSPPKKIFPKRVFRLSKGSISVTKLN